MKVARVCVLLPTAIHRIHLVVFSAMKYSDFEAHVCVEGQYLDEYQVSNEGENALMCWIASEEGKVNLFRLFYVLFLT